MTDVCEKGADCPPSSALAQVVRLIASNTVEQSLLKLQETKREIAKASFHQSRDELRSVNLQMLRSVFDL